jgi:hypothetical protein
MRFRAHSLSMSVMTVLILVCTGCGQRDAQWNVSARALGLANLQYIDSKLKKVEHGQWIVGPESLEELVAFDELLADFVPQMQEHEAIVLWGYEARVNPEEYNIEFRSANSTNAYASDAFILAYPKSALSKGGLVLLSRGMYIEMSAAELNEKLKEQSR